MKILTCNIRTAFASKKDGENGWGFRKDICAQQIKSQSPDIICFQEMTSTQFDDLSQALPEYENYGMVDDSLGHDPANSIFYRRDLFALVRSGGFMLSETPHIPSSKSWGSAYVRFANWVRLKDKKSGIEFRVVNTHLDNISELARENQARLIVENTEVFPADYPQILTGDMNEDVTYKGIQNFKTGGWVDTYNLIHGTENPEHTFHGFQGPDSTFEMGKMDWVFVRGNIKTLDAKIIKDKVNGKYVSDHYFVSATLSF